jgi:hypothetical protein
MLKCYECDSYDIDLDTGVCLDCDSNDVHEETKEPKDE